MTKEYEFIEVWMVHTNNDDRSYGEPTHFFSSSAQATQFAFKNGWYGGDAPVTTGKAIRIGERYFLIDQEFDLDGAKEKEEEKLRASAASKLTSDSVWFEIIDQYPDFKEWVIHNKYVPIAILRKLASDSDAEIRSAVAMKRKTPEDVLRVLAKDRDEMVRSSVAFNAKTPNNILADLVNDSVSEIAETATDRLKKVGKQSTGND